MLFNIKTNPIPKSGIQISEIKECVVWMIPFALAIKDEGFDNPKLQQTLDEESTPHRTIQCHTVDLQLLVISIAFEIQLVSNRAFNALIRRRHISNKANSSQNGSTARTHRRYHRSVARYPPEAVQF